jgi:hypothetical protein
MANTRKTQITLIDEIIEVVKVHGTQEQVDFLNKKKDQIARKNENKGLTATQKANEILLDIIKENLSKSDKAIRINELQAMDERLAVTETGEPISNQKISALLKKLVDNNEVTKVIEKKIAYFKMAN